MPTEPNVQIDVNIRIVDPGHVELNVPLGSPSESLAVTPESGGRLLLLFVALAPLLMLRRANSGISLPRVSTGE